MSHAAELFVYSEPSDRALRDDLCARLAPLVEAGLIRELPTDPVDNLPSVRVTSADVVVVLLSPDALAEGSTMRMVIKDALALEQERRTVVIPVRARACTLDSGPLADRVVYPRDSTPLDSALLHEYAFRDVIAGVLTGITLCHVTVGDLLLASERETAASASFRHALSIAERLSSEFPDDTDHLTLLALVRDRLGDAFLAMGEGQSALAAFQSAKVVHQRLVATAVDTVTRRRLLARCLESIGDVLRATGDRQLALQVFQECLSLREELARETGTVAARREVASTHVRLGHVLRALGGSAGALAAFRQGMLIAEALEQEAATSISSALVTKADAAAFQAERALFCFRTASVLAEGDKDERDEARLLLLRALAVYHDLEQRGLLPESYKIWPPAAEAMLDSLDR